MINNTNYTEAVLTNSQPFGIYVNPKVTYTLHITDSFSIEMTRKMPSPFHRFMQKVFFGFRYKKKTE